MAMFAILILPPYSRLDGGRHGAAVGGGPDCQPPHGFRDPLSLHRAPQYPVGVRGITGNTPVHNTTGAVAMFVGRFFMIIPAMAIAGSLAVKKSVPPSAGTFPTDGGLFVGLVVGVILIVGGLTFFPALALGPIVDQLAMTAGTLF